MEEQKEKNVMDVLKENNGEQEEGPVVQGKGSIYGNAKIPVKILDRVIILGIAAIIILIFLELC